MSFLGIDIGTTGTKAIVLDRNGQILGRAEANYPLSVPQPGWSEQEPEDWWTATRACMEQLEHLDIEAIGLAGQMHGAVFLDAELRVIRPAILWNDQRTVHEVAEIESVVGSDRIRALTLNPPLTGFQLPKLLWLRHQEPNSYERLRHLLLPKDFVRLRLTGALATDVSDASGTGAFDVRNRRWSEETLRALNLNGEIFPAVFESDMVTGHTNGGIPVVGGGGDQAASAIGTGAAAPGVVSISLGTSGVVFSAIDQPGEVMNDAIHMFCHANRAWHTMGVTLNCGGSLRWYRDTLRPGENYDQLAAEASEVVPGSEGLVFHPYLSGERCPHNDPSARALFYGASLAHRRAHFTRAVFEGATFGLADAFHALGAPATEVVATGGGARSTLWCQMLSDVLGIPCKRLVSDEGPALGAAMLAGVGVGAWADVHEAVKICVTPKDRLEPSGADYGPAYAQYRHLYRSIRDTQSLQVN
jgi:xylulokinase